MKPETIEKIKQHYEHAKQKHSYFADEITRIEDESFWRRREISYRRTLKTRIELNNVGVDDVLNCEVCEMLHAFTAGNTAAAVEECYDAIAVLLRTIDVLEGRQALGDPAKKGE